MFKIISIAFRIIVAAVFIFSGSVKLIDPYGTAYKIQDYLETIHFVLPLWLALFAALVQAIVEFLLGMNALFKVNYERTTHWLMYIMGFFTAVTLYIAIEDPIQDCGCFGDALVISNWQTFYKNIVLLLFSVSMFRSRNFLRSRITEHSQQLLSGVFIVFALLVAINALRHLPAIDFRPYAVGTDIPEQMKVPEGMPQDIYKTTFVYSKGGEEQEFTEENYPWQDTTWTYVDSRNVLVSKGAEPAIHDFTISNDEMGDVTQDVLMDDRYTFMLVSSNINKVSNRHNDDISHLMSYCAEHDFPFMLLTSSGTAAVSEFKSHFNMPLDVYSMDEITLKTIIRANPGLLIVKDGVILAKYHHNDLPSFTKTDKPISSILRQHERRNNQLKVLLLVLFLAGIVTKLCKKKDFTK